MKERGEQERRSYIMKFGARTWEAIGINVQNQPSRVMIATSAVVNCNASTEQIELNACVNRLEFSLSLTSNHTQTIWSQSGLQFVLKFTQISVGSIWGLQIVGQTQTKGMFVLRIMVNDSNSDRKILQPMHTLMYNRWWDQNWSCQFVYIYPLLAWMCCEGSPSNVQAVSSSGGGGC